MGWSESSCGPTSTCLPRLQGRWILLDTLNTHPGGGEDLRERQRSKTKTTDLKHGFPGDSAVKNPPANAGHSSSTPVLVGSLEKEMATHSNILAWRRIGEPGGLQSMGSQRVGHDLATKEMTELKTARCEIQRSLQAALTRIQWPVRSF